MRIISTEDWPGTQQELVDRVNAFVAALEAHKLTVGIPAPREIDLVEQLAASGEEFEVYIAPPAGYFISAQDGGYYEGERRNILDTSAPQRPSALYDWDGVQWVLNIARQAEQQRLADLSAALTADTQIQALKAMTNAEFEAWWDANITTAAQAIAVLKRLTRVMIRRLL
jgi:hypothetical protein